MLMHVSRAAGAARKLREKKLDPLVAKVDAAKRRKERELKREAMRLEAIARWETSGRPRRSAAKVHTCCRFISLPVHRYSSKRSFCCPPTGYFIQRDDRTHQ